MIPPKDYYLELHLAQVEDEITRINNKVSKSWYDNKLVVDYIKYLNYIIEGLRKIDRHTITDNDKDQIRDILIFVSVCIQYLKSATKADLKPALYVCLRCAMEDWVKDSQSHYVLTSYKATVSSHHFLSYTIDSQAIKLIYDVLGITIPYKLVAIGYPTYLEKDFLSNVSLYHELGHFVDLCEWKISLHITARFINSGIPMNSEYFNGIDEQILRDKKHSCHDKEIKRLYNLISEYFADIFAAQYIGRHKMHLSHYMAGDNGFSYTHPSISARTRAIENFLQPENTHDDFIKALLNETQRITGKELKIRNESLILDPLLARQPYINLNKNQLHSLLQNAWELWENDTSGFRTDPDSMTAYQRINDLLEQSIMNYHDNKCKS